MDPWKRLREQAERERESRRHHHRHSSYRSETDTHTHTRATQQQQQQRNTQPEWLREALRKKLIDEQKQKEKELIEQREREEREEELRKSHLQKQQMEQREAELRLIEEREREQEQPIDVQEQEQEVIPPSERASPSPHALELEDRHYRYDTPPGPNLPDQDYYQQQEQEQEQEQQQQAAPASAVVPSYVCSLASVARIGCRSVDEFKRVRTISEGAYGVVHEAIDTSNGEVVALKKIKMESAGGAGFPVTSLREINILMSIEHENIVGLREMVIGRKKTNIFMVMDYVPHELKSLMHKKKESFSASEVKCLLQQLLHGVQALHKRYIIHRDLKTSNLLLSSSGVLKIADLGLARRFGVPLQSYTPLVVTLWYRSPELLLGAPTYSTEVDMWAVGCIFAELVRSKPLFEGAQGELDQLQRIFSLLGTPSEENWPGFSELPHAKNWAWKPQPRNRLRKALSNTPDTTPSRSELSASGLDLMQRLLQLDPKQRISASEALEHAWFREAPKPQDPIMISTSIPKRRRD